MKKQVMFLVLGLSILSFSSLSFAETTNKIGGVKVRTINGTVQSVNLSRGLALIKDKDIPNYETVVVDSALIGSLQVGQTVTAVAFGGGMPVVSR